MPSSCYGDTAPSAQPTRIMSLEHSSSRRPDIDGGALAARTPAIGFEDGDSSGSEERKTSTSLYSGSSRLTYGLEDVGREFGRARDEGGWPCTASPPALRMARIDTANGDEIEGTPRSQVEDSSSSSVSDSCSTGVECDEDDGTVEPSSKTDRFQHVNKSQTSTIIENSLGRSRPQFTQAHILNAKRHGPCFFKDRSPILYNLDILLSPNYEESLFGCGGHLAGGIRFCFSSKLKQCIHTSSSCALYHARCGSCILSLLSPGDDKSDTG
jgi:hypothetical protein